MTTHLALDLQCRQRAPFEDNSSPRCMDTQTALDFGAGCKSAQLKSEQRSLLEHLHQSICSKTILDTYTSGEAQLPQM